MGKAILVALVLAVAYAAYRYRDVVSVKVKALIAKISK